MAKVAYFFSHDTNARQDPKLQEVLMELGLVGIGAYWCIIEMLYEQGGTLPVKSYKTIAFTLHVEVEVIRSLVEDFGLFNNDGDEFWSEAVLKRSEKRKELSDKRRTAISKRWNDQSDTNVIQTADTCNTKEKQSDTNVIQEENGCNTNPIYKEKKIKEKEIKENYNNSLSVSLPLSSESTEPENTGARASLADKQRFLEIFYFERNLIDPLQEVTRFCAHYDANGWMRGNTPIKDKSALAKLWKPQKEGERHKPVVVQWLREVYLKAKATDPEGAVRIMTETYGVGCDFRDNFVQVMLYISPAVKQVIERNLVFRQNWRVTYQLKQQ